MHHASHPVGERVYNMPTTNKGAGKATGKVGNAGNVPTRSGAIERGKRALCAEVYGVPQGAALLGACVTSMPEGVDAAGVVLRYFALGGAPWHDLAPRTRAHWQATHRSRWHGTGNVHEYAHNASDGGTTRCTVRHAGAAAQCDNTAPNKGDGVRRWRAEGVTLAGMPDTNKAQRDALVALAAGRAAHYAGIVAKSLGCSVADVAATPTYAALFAAGAERTAKALPPSKA